MAVERVDPQQMFRTVKTSKFRGYELDEGTDHSLQLLITNVNGRISLRLTDGEDLITMDYMTAKTLRDILMDELNINPSLITSPENT